MPKYDVIVNKQVVKTVTAADIIAAKKVARAEFGKKVLVTIAGEWAHITSPEFAERVRRA